MFIIILLRATMEMWIIWKFVISLNQVTAACNLFVLKCSIKWYILIYMYEYIFSFLHKGDESFLALIFGSLFIWCWSVNFLNFDWLSVRFFYWIFNYLSRARFNETCHKASIGQISKLFTYFLSTSSPEPIFKQFFHIESISGHGKSLWIF